MYVQQFLLYQSFKIMSQKRQSAEKVLTKEQIDDQWTQQMRGSLPTDPYFRPPTYQHRNQHSPNSIKHKSKPKQLQTNFSKKTLVPTFSRKTLPEEFCNEIQLSLLGENSNLKEHNNYLVDQIKTLFRREKRYKHDLAACQQKIITLEDVNVRLQNQLKKISHSVMAEIERLQTLIEKDAAERRSASVNADDKGMGWETESSVYQNLQELKCKMELLLNRKEEKTVRAGHYRTSSRLQEQKMLEEEQFRADIENLQLWSSNEVNNNNNQRKSPQTQQKVKQGRSSLNPENIKFRGRQ